MSQNEIDIINKKLDNIEDKVNNIHDGIYGNNNYKGMKHLVDDHDEIIEPIRWALKNRTFAIIILIGLMEGIHFAINMGIPKLLAYLIK